VLAGDMLVEIDSSDWRTSVNQVEEQLRAARSTYQQAMDSSRRQQQQAQSALEVAVRQWEEVQERKERITALHEAGAVSQQELELIQLEESLAAAGVGQAELALAAAGDALSPASRGSFEANIRQLESQREHLMTQQDSYLVTAPVGGTILQRHVEPGAFVQPGQLLMEIGDLDKLYVKADLLAREMAGVQEGMAVRVIHRDLGTAPATGTIRKVYPTAFSKVSELGIEQRRVQIEIEVDQIDPLWRPGYEVDVEVIKDTRENTLTVPERAVFWTDGREHLFIWENDQAVLRKVTTGLTAQNRIEIIAGLEEGQRVLTEPEKQ
jgi:HlyD family secretion protein